MMKIFQYLYLEMEMTRRRRRSSHGMTVAEANAKKPLPSVLRKSRRPFTPEACSEQVNCTLFIWICGERCLILFGGPFGQEMQDKLMDIYTAISRGEPYKQADRREKGLHEEKAREQPNAISQLWYRHPLEGLRVSNTTFI